MRGAAWRPRALPAAAPVRLVVEVPGPRALEGEIEPAAAGELPGGEVREGGGGDHAEGADEAQLAEGGLVLAVEGEGEGEVADCAPPHQPDAEREPVVERRAERAVGPAHDVAEIQGRGVGVPLRAVVELDSAAKLERDGVLFRDGVNRCRPARRERRDDTSVLGPRRGRIPAHEALRPGSADSVCDGGRGVRAVCHIRKYDFPSAHSRRHIESQKVNGELLVRTSYTQSFAKISFVL